MSKQRVLIQDIRKIIVFRILATPALVINGEVKSAGRIPNAAEITTWLTTAANKQQSGAVRARSARSQEAGWRSVQTTIDKFTFRVATDRLYTSDGVWVLPEQSQGVQRVRIGVSDYLQQHHGDVAFANVKFQGTTLKAGTIVRNWRP